MENLMEELGRPMDHFVGEWDQGISYEEGDMVIHKTELPVYRFKFIEKLDVYTGFHILDWFLYKLRNNRFMVTGTETKNYTYVCIDNDDIADDEPGQGDKWTAWPAGKNEDEYIV